MLFSHYLFWLKIDVFQQTFVRVYYILKLSLTYLKGKKGWHCQHICGIYKKMDKKFILLIPWLCLVNFAGILQLKACKTDTTLMLGIRLLKGCDILISCRTNF